MRSVGATNSSFAGAGISSGESVILFGLLGVGKTHVAQAPGHQAVRQGANVRPNPVVAESLLDRLINSSHQVIMNGPSYRPNMRRKGLTEKPGTPSNG
ncbi:ATP-binding protein [Streptomyces sp. NPDC102394]|uniref:ATP-binding protein n=1 Tax=Streptomyces sp. NPDC102394 TaxID=3366167 RepID=UPI00382713F2